MQALRVNSAHRAGDVIGGRYRLRRVIGEGGTGIVWEAEQITQKRKVAVKVLSDDARSPTASARFEREAHAASEVDHPNVVRVVDQGRLPGGAPFLVMEHLAGETLEEVLEQRGALSIGEACEWLRPIAAALDAAHATGIVHRDVKPSNIVRAHTPDGPRVTLIDFGLAAGAGWDRLTGPGAILGTPAYLAPEVARGEPVDARADVYALGCVLFRMLTGRIPFQRPTVLATLTAKLCEPAPRLSEIAPEHGPFLPALEDLVARALAIDPALRPKSAGQLVMELVRIAEGRVPSAPPPPPPAPARARQGGSVMRFALAAAFFTAGVLAWWAGTA